MKKLTLIMLLSMICGLAFAAATDFSVASFKSAFEITSNTNNSMELEFSLPQYEITTQENNGQTFHRIVMPGAGTLMQSGMPELPVITTTIAIPHQGGVNIEVINSQQSVISNYHAYPLQQDMELENPKSFVQDTQYYGGGGEYPTAAIEYSDPKIIRDFRVITVQVNPFSYNAATQELTAHTNINMRVNYTGGSGINELTAPVHHISPAFDKIYSSFIQNYHEYRDLMVANTPPRYLIIHGQSQDVVFNTALNGFATWKRQKGADVDIANTSSSSAGSSSSSIRTYIRNQYNNPETRPDYVILIGDVGGSFSIPCFQQSYGATDYPYTFMNTGDMLGDVFIGRISVENSTQFLVLLNKIYAYEKNLDVDNAEWLNRMLLVGDNDPSGISTMYISKYIKEMALEENSDNTFTELYGANFSSLVSGINSAFNQGISFYSFRGYIDFSPPSESALSGSNMIPHAVIITCGTGNFDGSGETEQLIRYGTTALPKGAVTAIGMSTSSTHTTFNNVLHGGIFEGIYTRGMRTMGEALLNGKLYIDEIFGVSSPGSAVDFAHWCNLMGDPTMEVYTGIPDRFNVQTEETIPLGLRLLDVAVTDYLTQEAVEGASVVLSSGFDILSRGYTDADGNVILVLPDAMQAGDAVLTIHKHNFKPKQIYIVIEDEPTLVPGDIVIDDSASSNPNGLASAGESIQVSFALRNTGAEALQGVSGMVTSDSPWLQIENPSINYSEIPAYGSADNTSPIILNIHDGTPNNTMLRLHLYLSDSNDNEYHVSEFILVESPIIELISYQVSDDNPHEPDSNQALTPQNNILDPGEEAVLTVELHNIATVSVSDVYARLHTHNDLLSITSNMDVVGELNGVDQIQELSFNVWLRPQTLSGMQIPLYLELFNEAGFEQIIDFNLDVGTVDNDTPLGPDDYGYVIYDWNDTDNPYAAYNWIPIAEQEGGFGTALPISDIYNGSDEGDQVGAQSLAVVDLPFSFRFYGRHYNQITVCSNGFIAMGVTANAEFRNFRLPGAMGPSPMIAPFWDDLATHSGSGIYTMFDRGNRSFIIEWYNLRNGKNGTSPETFQVILYDQSVHNTSMGDGPIKFQYHTFNNVDSQSGSRHGNYATIGIEDHTGTRGLEYTFNNQYPPTASSLSNGTALYISNVPIYHEAANIFIADTYLADSNMIIEPGETVRMGILLQNSGNIPADNIVADLTTEDPYVNLQSQSSEYYALFPGESGVNKQPYVFSISEDCPAGHLINFEIAISSMVGTWNHNFTMQVDSSKLRYHSYMINDYDGNHDGVINEANVQLIINLRNISDLEARNIEANLSTDISGVIIENPQITEIDIAPNQIMQIAFDLSFSGVDPELDLIPVLFNAQPQGGEGEDVILHVPYNQPNVKHNFDSNDGNFVSETGWAWGVPQNVTAYSPDKVWATNLSGEYPINVQYHLYTPKYILDSGSELSFMHYYGTEENYDGVNVAISTNNGNSWIALEPQGGYNGTDIVGLNMERGWTGNSMGWIPASFDLSSYAQQQVMFRFRLGTNGATNGIGWYIDDFELTNVVLKTGFVQGNVYTSSGINPRLTTVMSNQRYATTPADNGSFKLFLPNGTHTVTASTEYHQSSTISNVVISPSSPVFNTDFVLINLPAADNFHYILSDDSVDLSLHWEEPLEPLLPISSYRVYKRFNSGPFEIVQESSALSFSEQRTVQGSYYYYVTAIYMGVEGSPTNTVLIGNPFVDNDDDVTPELVTTLESNYPNPFNPTTTIAFNLAESGPVTLNIYNTKGQLVNQLANANYSAGKHYLIWNGRDKDGRPVSSGLYFYRLIAKNYANTRKMIMMK